MHYRIHLFTKELPTEDQIRDIMAPYCDEAVYYDENGEDKKILSILQLCLIILQ